MSSITKQILSGAKWTSISTIIITVIQVVQFAILGNVLSKEEFGLVGMITTVTIFTQILLDMGIGAAIIQKEKVSDDQLSTLYWLNIIVGLLLFFMLFFSSGLISGFYNQPMLEDLIKILSIMFLIAPIGQQFQYLIQKDLNFNLLSKIEVISNVLAFLLLIVLIFLMDEILAYVLSIVFLNSFKGVYYFYSYAKTWKPKFVLNVSIIKEFLSFGFYQLLSRLVNRVGSNIDYILIGRFLGAEALGIYSLAYQIITIPVLKINPIITRVAFPVFSKNQANNAVLTEGFLNVTKALALVSFPILIGLMSVSDVFVQVVFGERWLDAVPIINILAIVGLLRVLMNPNGSILLAKGKANFAFYWDFGIMILYGVSLYIATKFNLEVVAWTYVVTSLINFFVGRWLLKVVIDMEFKEYFKTILKPLIITLLMGITIYLLNVKLFVHLINIPLVNLVILVGLGMCVYLLILFYSYPDLRMLVRKRLRRQKA